MHTVSDSEKIKVRRRRLARRKSLRIFRMAASHRRNTPNDIMLGMVLSFVAGAINAGGFLAIGQYTSHMTGIVSSIADNLALGLVGLVGVGLAALVFFTTGAACSAILINWARRHRRHQQYAYPLALESGLLIVFGAIGAFLPHAPIMAISTGPLLCFIMGLQNATITKISSARIRTTHLTGMVTDIGIELGKLGYRKVARMAQHAPMTADGKKLGVLVPIVTMFFLGGLIGALGFKHLGYGFSLPLAALLLALASPQLRPRVARSA
ncbi:protein of unknown function DUF1275 [Rhizobium sp. PDO1-076]|nr:protein of unknown function DUF1275 [Rhizobium sp. PDO1-076]